MSVNSLVQITVGQLALGMYVSQLDRPWLETPFLFQGFPITNPAEIEELRKYCEYVYIDTSKGRRPPRPNPLLRKEHLRPQPAPAPATEAGSGTPAKARAGNLSERQQAQDNQTTFLLSVHRTPDKQRRLQNLFPNRTLRSYQDQCSARTELKEVKQTFTEFTDSMHRLVKEAQISNTFDIEQLQAAVEPIVDSIMRNPDACMWLARMKNKDSYTYKHSMGTAVWAVALGRQIGLPKVDLKNLASGAALCDVGKLTLPDELLSKTEPLSRGEATMMKAHVDLGLDLLRGSSGMNRQILSIVACHHERFNGTGYPREIQGSQIPVLAQIAGIADSYDAMTSERPYAAAISPSHAVRLLYKWRDQSFHGALIEEFIQAVGLYPAGTLVELSDGAVGIVISESRTHRLHPRLLILIDEQKRKLKQLQELDLLEHSVSKTATTPLYIVNSLSPGSYGIDPESIYY